MSGRRLIVTADDFGLAPEVNEAIELAHREGVLQAASLMVGGSAAQDAVERARRLPGLRVGLHLVVVEGRPVLAPERVPALVDAAGELDTRLFRAGLRFFFLPAARAQLEAEIRAQFEAFRKTGLRLDHANAHNHMHLHPTVLGLMLRVGREYGLSAVRIPYEPPGASARAAGGGWLGRAAPALALAPWRTLLRFRLRRARIRYNDQVFGLNDSGRMQEELVLRQLDELPQGVTEMYFHVASCASAEQASPGPGPAGELAALTSPRVRAALARRGIELIAFEDLAYQA